MEPSNIWTEKKCTSCNLLKLVSRKKIIIEISWKKTNRSTEDKIHLDDELKQKTESAMMLFNEERSAFEIERDDLLPGIYEISIDVN